ncbi:phosphatase PAP2 family protein [Prevotella sp.]|uniref:phosphatase PAP2 family protein n=1 Tax=uncultured Prevotella sp. TaxID=159272 RepID=UPI0025F8D237|nr:phosphatase PAP2 family protein [uncultured Prevotella sp.]
MKEKNIILAARVLSMVFTPFYLSLVGLIALFTFSYLSLMPWAYKLTVLTLVYLFTILIPTLLIHFYRNYHGWTLIELGKKERRVVPYLLSIVSYFVCYYVMHRFNIPHFMSNILMAALIIQILCALINVWWKISTHTAAIGGVMGALQAFAVIFGFNPIGWLCLVLILAGMVGTSRMILRQHSLRQVCYGFLLGLVVAYGVILGL